MSEFNDMATLTGFHKIVYGDKLTDLVPEGVKLAKMVAFSKADKRQGLEYRTPVNLRLEHGVSYLGPNGTQTSLQSAIAGATAEASVKGCEMILRGRIGIAAISRSVNDKASYGRATKHVIKNLLILSFVFFAFKIRHRLCFLSYYYLLEHFIFLYFSRCKL
jgi:hypothetical protein